MKEKMPKIRRIQAGRDTKGKQWIGLVRNNSFAVVGVEKVPIMPGYLLIILFFGLIMMAWARESHA